MSVEHFLFQQWETSASVFYTEQCCYPFLYKQENKHLQGREGDVLWFPKEKSPISGITTLLILIIMGFFTGYHSWILFSVTFYSLYFANLPYLSFKVVFVSSHFVR